MPLARRDLGPPRPRAVGSPAFPFSAARFVGRVMVVAAPEISPQIVRKCASDAWNLETSALKQLPDAACCRRMIRGGHQRRTVRQRGRPSQQAYVRECCLSWRVPRWLLVTMKRKHLCEVAPPCMVSENDTMVQKMITRCAERVLRLGRLRLPRGLRQRQRWHLGRLQLAHGLRQRRRLPIRRLRLTRGLRQRRRRPLRRLQLTRGLR